MRRTYLSEELAWNVRGWTAAENGAPIETSETVPARWREAWLEGYTAYKAEEIGFDAGEG